jgi:branched-subunit amino acid ABC-type transport system permease component
MKQAILNFIRRGAISCGLGPIVLAILYLILHRQANMDVLTVKQVCIGIFSLSALAFIAGGMNVIYQIERLPLMVAILIHGCVLYISYLITYLVNDWLEFGVAPILVFSAIFVIGYLAIWAVIYTVIQKRTAKINELLKQKQLHSTKS